MAFFNQRRTIRAIRLGDLALNKSPSGQGPEEPPSVFLIGHQASAGDVECSMSEAEEYVQNAQICASIAQTTKSDNDRAIWLRMSEAWRDLAEIAEQHASTIHQGEAAAA
jgi:hypothetical protein